MATDKDLLDATATVAAALLGQPGNANLTPGALHQLVVAIGDGLRANAAKVHPGAVATVAAAVLRNAIGYTPATVTSTIKNIATALAAAAATTGD